MKPTLVLSIFANATFERLQVRQEISVREDDAARLGGRS